MLWAHVELRRKQTYNLKNNSLVSECLLPAKADAHNAIATQSEKQLGEFQCIRAIIRRGGISLSSPHRIRLA